MPCHDGRFCAWLLMSELPEGWIDASLEEISHVVRGITFPASAKEVRSHDSNVCCLRTSNIQRSIDWRDVYFVASTFVKRQEQFVRVGDVLMSMANSYELVGKVALVEKIESRAAFGAFLAAIRPSVGINGKLLFYLLKTEEVQNALREGSSQTTNIANISISRLAKIPIPLPPLPEQTRIANKLDTLLDRVDSARERLDRVPEMLKRFRQSVLTAATLGVLTETWRVQYNVLIPWSTGTLSAILDGKPRNGYSPKSVDTETPVKSLTLTATTSGKFQRQYFKYIDEHIPSNSYLWLQPDDILIQRANTLEYVGVSAIYDGPSLEFIYPDLIMKARSNDSVLPKFLLYIIQSDGLRTHFRANATGTAGNMPKINQQTILNAPCCWPTLHEQTEIVRQVEILFAYADRLESRLKTARKLSENLSPAILAKAFRGELVPQDPNDEPAVELLKRIRKPSLP